MSKSFKLYPTHFSRGGKSFFSALVVGLLKDHVKFFRMKFFRKLFAAY